MFPKAAERKRWAAAQPRSRRRSQVGRRSLSGSAAARHSDAEWDAERPVLGSELPSLGSRVRASSPALTEAPATGPFICAYGRMLNRYEACSASEGTGPDLDRARVRAD